MDGNLATTYTLIYSFLINRSHTKVAQALKKAATDVVILKDDVHSESPSLDVIIKEWKIAQQKTKADSSSSDSDDSSDSSSGDNSSSGRSSSSTKRKKPSSESGKMSSKSKEASSQQTSSSDSSDSGSSSSSSSGPESDDESSDTGSSKAKLQTKKFAKTKVDEKPKANRQSSVTLTSGSVSGPDANRKGVGKKTEKKDVKKDTKSSDDSDSDSSDDSNPPSSPSLEGDITKNGQTTQKEKTKVKAPPILSSSSSSDSDLATSGDTSGSGAKSQTPSGNVPVTKKRRISENSAVTVRATTGPVDEQKTQSGRPKGNKGARQKTNIPFQRINPDRVPQYLVQDNGYTAKAGPTNDYGQRAHQDLITTRGSGFRKEKNKKKRGSYKGGEITLESHSFKFD